MGLSMAISKSVTLWILLGFVKCQDSQNYFFTPTNPAQGRFVPSFQNSRSPSYISGSQNSLSNAASSYPEQLILLDNDGPSAPQTSQLTTGFSQFAQHLPLQQTTRNPDYYDISPRPFGVPTGSQSFTRPKALRPSSSSGSGFVPISVHQTRTNVPHQQTQFLAQFGEQNAPISSPAATSSYQANRINGGGRPFNSNGGSSSAFNRIRPYASNTNTYSRQQQTKPPTSSFDEELPTPVRQQLPFRNTRTRFQPSSAKTSTTTTTSAPISKSSRYNRFGSARSPPSTSTELRQSSTAPSSSKVRLPAAPTSVNRTLFQPRRPVFISREINRPFGGRITVNHNGSDKSVPINTMSQEEGEDEDIEESEEDGSLGEDIREQNHVSSRPKGEIFEKLSLHESGASLPASSSVEPPLSTSGVLPPTMATSDKAQDDHTVILTSNFYLPGSYEDEDEGEEDGDVAETTKDNPEEMTTNNPTDYEYEYVEAITTTIQPMQLLETNSTEPVTELEPEAETNPTDLDMEQTTKVSETSVEVTTEPSAQIDVTTEPPLHESSTAFDEDEEYEDTYGSGGDGSGEYFDENTQIIAVNEVVGREVVSVVTTKSVINGSTAVPHPVTPSTITFREEQIYKENKLTPAKETVEDLPQSDGGEESAEEQSVNNTTESYVVIASIQTSRSINGARFLPFPAIEQEETKQTLSELERKIHGKNSRKKPQQSANESIETVSSNELPPDFNVTSSTTEATTIEETTTQATTTTTSFKFVPNIRKFMPKTSPKPKINLDEIPQDDLTSFLPAGFKPRPSYKNKKLPKATTPVPAYSSEDNRKPLRNSTIGRSYKNSPNAAQDVALAGLLPKGYRPHSTTEAPPKIDDILRKIKFEDNLDKLLPADFKEKVTTPRAPVTFIDDLSKFLPPGFKLTTTTSKPVIKVDTNLSKLLPPGYKPAAEDKTAISVDISKLLPPGYKPTVEDKAPAKIAVASDISKFLPPGFKLDTAQKVEAIDISKLLLKDFKPATKDENKETILKKIEFKDVADLLPPGFKSPDATTTQTPVTTTTASSGFKLVFPKGIHKRPGQRLTTPQSVEGGVVTPPSVLIKKGPPQRSSTEFTGWPTPSTTPISIEKLLEQARTATIDISELLPQTSTTTTTTSTTTTTPEPPKPTKPGHCKSDCDLAGTIKIIDGVTWKPELLDHNTAEWKNLAREVEAQLNEVYSNAPLLSHWYKKVRIDSFSKGSVLVDYFVELGNITQDVNTLEMKKLFHQALTQPPLPVVPLHAEVENETDSDDDEHFKEGRGEKLVKETYLMGRFVVDPTSTDFIVIPKSFSPTVEFAEDDAIIPHWAIVLIVIGVGSLCFVVIFGVTVLLNRQKRAKKTPIPLTADMMNDLKVNHMGGSDNFGVDDFYNIDDAWNDTKQPIKPKRFTNSMHGSSGSNIYDSWRSTRHGDYYYDSHNYTPHGKGEQQYPPDAFADVHQMYTYNHPPRSRYQRDYDPDF